MPHLTCALAACAVLALAADYPPRAAHASTPQLYLYEGNSCSVAAQNAAARNMLGRVEDGDDVFISDNGGAAEVAYTNVDYGLGCYQGQVANVALAVPLQFDKESSGSYGLTAGAYTLADVAAGKLDPFYAHVAHSAVSHGFAHAHMRLGWEMSGNWYSWKAQGRTAVFQAAFCHVAAVMRAAVPTAKFTYWDNPSTNTDASNEGPTCPAADVGVAWDQYESYWTQAGATSEPAAWTKAYGGWWGIDSMGSWYGSSRHAAPEFGVGLETTANASTTTDDPAFMAKLIAYDESQNVEFMGLWDAPAWTGYPGLIHDGTHPGETLEVLKTWGPAALQPLIAGAKLYTGPLKAKTPGFHQVMAINPAGQIILLVWADGAPTSKPETSLSQARVVDSGAPRSAWTFSAPKGSLRWTVIAGD